MDLILVDRDPENATYWYNLACSYCRLDRFDACLQALKKGIEKGYDDFVWMLKDDDLAGIRHHPEFKQIVSELKNR